jgi:hypothetical protein
VLIWGIVLLVAVWVAAVAWLVVHAITAPLLDEEGRLIGDPYGTMGPRFKDGDPVPQMHHGKVYADPSPALPKEVEDARREAEARRLGARRSGAD